MGNQQYERSVRMADGSERHFDVHPKAIAICSARAVPLTIDWYDCLRVFDNKRFND